MNEQEIGAMIARLTIAENGTIREAMETIDRGAMGVALLCRTNGRFVGMVTDGDIRRALLSGKGLEARVIDIANLNPVTLLAGADSTRANEKLTERSRFLPVIDDAGRVVNLVYYDKRSHLPMADPTFGQKELDYVTECILTGWVSSAGKFVSRFEELFAEFCGVKYAVSVCNGTCALHLALHALDIQAGDEVIVPTLSFIASANAVRYTGAEPIFVDSEPRTWNVDPQALYAAITPRTKAIMPVHLYGHPADMDTIREVADRHRLLVIEDAAEAHGAMYKGRRVGGIGDVGCFSFYGNKIITTGEGGMVVTDRKDVADRMRMLRDHGMSPVRRYWHPILGYNYRLTNIQAALGVAQMERIDWLLARKREIAQAYSQRLRAITGITLPIQESWASSVFWLNSILVDESKFGLSRDELMARLKDGGIETRPVFPCIHRQPIYNTGARLPVAQHISENGLSLPSAVNLTLASIERIVDSIANVRRHSGS